MLKSQHLTEKDLAGFGFKAIGTNVRTSSDCRIYGAENISIGDNVRIDDFTILSGANGFIDIGSYVFIARSGHLSGKAGIRLHDFSSMAANTVIYSSCDDYQGEYMTAHRAASDCNAAARRSNRVPARSGRERAGTDRPRRHPSLRCLPQRRAHDRAPAQNARCAHGSRPAPLLRRRVQLDRAARLA